METHTKKQLMNWMVVLAAGAFMFVMLVVLAASVGAQMGNAVAACQTANNWTLNTSSNTAAAVCYRCADGYTWNATSGNNSCCDIGLNATCDGLLSTGAGTAGTTNAYYIIGQLGSGGLSGYLPLIFIAAIAIGILSMMGMGIGRKGNY